MSSSLTDADWDKVMADHGYSLGELRSQYWDSNHSDKTPEPAPIDLSELRPVPFIREMGNGTAKARFFVTQDDHNGVFGYWCPRSVIMRVGKDAIYLQKDCGISLKIIRYKR